MEIFKKLIKIANKLDSLGEYGHADSIDSILKSIASDGLTKPAAVKGGYLAIVLDESSHETLLSWWRENIDSPIHSKVYAHHVTLKYQPTQEELDSIELDVPTSLEVSGWAADDDVQAVSVQIQLPCANKVPHITIATSEKGKPAQSNTLLQSGIKAVGGPSLTGIVKYVTPFKK